MRDLDIIDSELRLLAPIRRTVAELGRPLPSIGLLDELPDERAATAKGHTPALTALRLHRLPRADHGRRWRTYF